MPFLLSSPLWKAFWVSANYGDNHDTSVTTDLNAQIQESDGSCGTYCGWGAGVIIRNPYDGYETGGGHMELVVVPATFWHNDVVSGNGVFPSTGGSDPSYFTDKTTFPDEWWGITSYNIDCPNNDWNGYFNIGGIGHCKTDPGTGDNSPWRYANTGYVIGDAMKDVFYDWDNIQSPDWGWGVFYPTDSNSVDYRCRWLDDDQIYDCPPDPSDNKWWKGGYIDTTSTWHEDTTKYGTGRWPAGNPTVNDKNGGGTGCHFDKGGSKNIDQTDGESGGLNLVMDHHCQCDWTFNDDWSHWVQWWIDHATPKKEIPDDEHWLGGSGKGAPSRALDMASCWVNNLRDMIDLQNAFWWKRFEWSNQMAPATNWQLNDPNSQWGYWGWNEIPMTLSDMTPHQNHQAIFIHLPPSICGNGGGDDSVDCLGAGQQMALENDLDKWVHGDKTDNFGYLLTGYENMAGRPGSYVVFVREWYTPAEDRWRKWFFCEKWWGPAGKYKIVSWATGTNGAGDYGACYLDTGSNYHKFYGSATTEVV